MVIMSDGEAFGLRLTVVLSAILLLIFLITKPIKQSNGLDDNPTYSTPPEPVTMVDTLYLKDTVYINKIKHDTVYIPIKDSI